MKTNILIFFIIFISLILSTISSYAATMQDSEYIIYISDAHGSQSSQDEDYILWSAQNTAGEITDDQCFLSTIPPFFIEEEGEGSQTGTTVTSTGEEGDDDEGETDIIKEADIFANDIKCMPDDFDGDSIIRTITGGRLSAKP